VAVKVVSGTRDALNEVKMHQSLRHVGVCPILDSFHYQVSEMKFVNFFVCYEIVDSFHFLVSVSVWGGKSARARDSKREGGRVGGAREERERERETRFRLCVVGSVC